jgi:RNA polymerase sigma-70 factor (ECF subfamily)
MLADERRTGLLTAIAALRPEDRLVIGCRYLLELSEAETAAALGVRRGTVKSRLSRALERLRGELENDG